MPKTPSYLHFSEITIINLRRLFLSVLSVFLSLKMFIHSLSAGFSLYSVNLNGQYMLLYTGREWAHSAGPSRLCGNQRGRGHGWWRHGGGVNTRGEFIYLQTKCTRRQATSASSVQNTGEKQTDQGNLWIQLQIKFINFGYLANNFFFFNGG